MSWLAHADPQVTFRVYTHVMNLAKSERDELAAILGTNHCSEGVGDAESRTEKTR